MSNNILSFLVKQSNNIFFSNTILLSQFLVFYIILTIMIYFNKYLEKNESDTKTEMKKKFDSFANLMNIIYKVFWNMGLVRNRVFTHPFIYVTYLFSSRFFFFGQKIILIFLGQILFLFIYHAKCSCFFFLGYH